MSGALRLGLGELETIVAHATGPGRGALAIIRLSGPHSWRVLEALVGGNSAAIPERKASLRRLFHPIVGELLDEAVVVGWRAPASSTGEDVIELHVHGGPAVVSGVVSACLATGLCRGAGPGEFTLRAFENGRIDLLQAEAIGDLVDAETDGQRRYALAALQGKGSVRVAAWRTELVEVMALLEAAVDFVEEGDIPADVAHSVNARLGALASELAHAAADLERGEMARDGFRVAILGRPNVGKSSLLNALARRPAAIVSPVAGTTRDVVEVRLVLSGFPVWIADTAGLRETADAIESEGVRRSLERADDADLRIWVESADPVDNPHAGPLDDYRTHIRPGDWIVLNKVDLLDQHQGWGEHKAFRVAAMTGEGIDALLGALAERVAMTLGKTGPPLLGHARHQRLVLAAMRAVDRARGALSVGVELCAEDLRLAARQLSALTGSVDVEDVLGEIFARFCVGK